MELKHYAGILFRWLWLIVLGTLLAAGIAYLVSRNIIPTYQASTMLMVSPTSNAAASSYENIISGQQLAKTYGELLKRRSVLEQVIRDLGLAMTPEQLSRLEDVQTLRDTQLIVVRFENEDPARAAALANRIARIFIEENQTAQPVRFAGSVVIAEPAAVPNTPVRPNVLLNTVLAAAIGAIVTIGLALLIESLDDRIHTSRQVTAMLGCATLGRIPGAPARNPVDRLVVQNDPRSPAAEAYRVLRTHIQFADADEPPKTILVTGAGLLEGKSTAATNLAAALAQGGLAVALVDADLRRPVLHRIFQTPNDRGLTTLLLQGPDELDGFIQQTNVENLCVLPAGPTPPNPSELLGCERMHRLIDNLKQRYDLVILDSPPVLAVADASILAPQVDGVILAVDAGKTRREPAQTAVETLTQVGGNILGVVLMNFASQHRHLGISQGGIDFVKTTIV